MKTFLTSAAFISWALTGPVLAADTIEPAHPVAGAVAANIFDWSGFYVGANVGHGAGEGASVFTVGGDAYYGGLSGGIQVGYNFAIDRIVVGIEGDYQLANIRHNRDLGAGVTGNAGFNSIATVRGRVGADLGSVMPYLTAGAAFASMGYEIDTVDLSDSNSGWGWAVGAGIEAGLTDNISFKGEYLYVDVDGGSVTLSGFDADMDAFAHTAKVGLNYHF